MGAGEVLPGDPAAADDRQLGLGRGEVVVGRAGGVSGAHRGHHVDLGRPAADQAAEAAFAGRVVEAVVVVVVGGGGGRRGIGVLDPGGQGERAAEVGQVGGARPVLLRRAGARASATGVAVRTGRADAARPALRACNKASRLDPVGEVDSLAAAAPGTEG